MIDPYSSSRPRTHGRFLWYELATTDLEGARSFYREVVGWGARDASAPGMGYTLFTAAAGGAVAGLMSLPADAMQSGFRPGWLGYVGVEDVDLAAERACELGGALHVPPKEIPGVSRFAIAVDPQMATIGLFQWITQHDEPSIDINSPGRVGWHELIATDWESAWRFYAALFGWQKEETDSGAFGTYQLFSAGGETIGGMFNKAAAGPAAFWLYYFNAGDIDEAMKRVKAAGGQMLDAPIEVPGNRWIIRCTDPQGAMFALVGTRRHHGLGYFERVPRGRA
jgi:predicted enzyme related to lactoylglutathione lyase